MIFKKKDNKNLEDAVQKNEKPIDKQKKKNLFTKKNVLITLIVLLTIAIFLIIFFKFILKDDVKVIVKEKDDKYPIFADTKLHNEVKVRDYINGYYVVENDYKLALMDKEGNLKTEYKYFDFQKAGNLISATMEKEGILLDKNMNTIMETEFINSYVCDNNRSIVGNDGSSSLIDKNGKVLLEGYDNITCQDDYIIAIKNEKEDIYKKNLKLVIKDVDVTDTFEYEYITYDINDNFIILREGEEKSVYFINSKKKSKKYSYVAINNDYVAVTDNGKVILKDKNGKTITKFNKSYEYYDIATKDLLIVPNDSCQAQAEGPGYSYADLYDSKGNKKTPDGCNNINIIKDDVIIYDSKNNITVYNKDKKVFEKKSIKESSVFRNQYGNFEYNSKDGNYILDLKGNKKIKECNSLYQLDKDFYNCSPTYEINYAYNDKGKILDALYSDVSYYLNNFIVVKNTNNKYGLYDKNGNKILDEKYDNITITDSIIIIDYNGKIYSKLIKYGDSKKYKEFIKKDNNIKVEKKEEAVINYDAIKIDEIISKYNLQSKKDLISNNEELFKKVAYHVTNNNKLSDSDKKYLLGMFDAMVDFNKYNKIDKLLSKIDKLEVKVFNSRPSEMTPWAVGNYFDSKTSIYILKNYYDYAIEHEMMHLLSHSAKIDENINIYECSGKVKSYEEVINMSFKEQSTCEIKPFDNDSRLLEEAGAEYFTTVVYENESYQTYNTNINVYVLLQHILEDDFRKLQYSPSKVGILYKLLNEKVGYDYEKASSLINAITDVSRIDNYNVDTKTEEAYILYHMADELINLYMAKNIGDWKDNEYLYSVIQSLLDNASKWNLDKYLRNNTDKKIEHYNDLVNLNHENCVYDRLKQINSNIYFSNQYYAHNKIVAHAVSPTYPGNFTLELYYNGKGNLIDKKVNISNEPVG